jgi:hypothetical protein
MRIKDLDAEMRLEITAEGDELLESAKKSEESEEVLF